MANTRTRSMTRLALKGGRWVAIQSVGLQLLSVVTTAILTRLLAPEDFGIVAITVVLIGLFGMVTEVGLNASVIRRPDLDQALLSTFFWLALILGGATATTLILLARPLAASFGEVEAAPLVAALAPVLLLTLARSVPRAVLSRRLRFGAVAMVDIADFVVYGTVSIATAAAFDIGAWAVIIGRLAAALASLLVMILLARWRPSWAFAWAGVREDLTFNLGVLASRVGGFAARNLDYWVVGRVLGARALGLYYIAYLLPNVLKNRLTLVTSDVMFPILSRISDDRPRLARAFLDSTRFMALIGFPMMLGLAVVADSAVPLLFGAKYAAAAQPASIIAVAAAMTILFNTSGPVFLADGVPHWSAGVNVARLAGAAVGLTIAAQVGTLVAVAWAVLGATTVGLLVSQFLIQVRLPIRVRDVVVAVAPATVSSAAMLAAVLGAKRAMGEAGLAWPGFVAAVATGVAAYLAFGLVVYRAVFVKFFKNLLTAVKPGDKGERRTSMTLERSAQQSEGAT